MAVLFAICTFILTTGFLWFWIVRPIMEDYGLIHPRGTVSDYLDSGPSLMSREGDGAPLSSPSSLETQNQTDRQTEQTPPIRAEQLLTLYKTMRAAGISREDAQSACKASGLPFNNNVWAKAAPAAQPESQYITPIVGRRTSAVFETDQDFPYQSPA